jgi:large subunit ribosomal protein L3
MPQIRKPRSGSLQFWPRKRIHKVLPSVNWSTITRDNGLLGFIGYKVGMSSAYVKDNTADSMTKGKKTVLPATIIECPVVKIYSVRFYKNHHAFKEFVVGFDDDLRRVLKKPQKLSSVSDIDSFTSSIKNDFDDVRVLIYSLPRKIELKKTPDIIEVAVGGLKDKKLAFIKERIGKELSVKDFISEGLVDVRGLTTGRGGVGPVKRFGIKLRSHKTEKGQRRPGTLGPWHPNRVTFRAPISGQLGLFTRVINNNMILKIGKISELNINPPQGFHRFGEVKADYMIVKGSVQGTKKRALLLTSPFRPTKKTAKQKYEFLELR